MVISRKIMPILYSSLHRSFIHSSNFRSWQFICLLNILYSPLHSCISRMFYHVSDNGNLFTSEYLIFLISSITHTSLESSPMPLAMTICLSLDISYSPLHRLLAYLLNAHSCLWQCQFNCLWIPCILFPTPPITHISLEYSFIFIKFLFLFLFLYLKII